MSVVLNWKQGLSFTGSAPGGHSVELDGHSLEESASFAPIELAAVALGGCTAMDVISILEKKKQRVTGFQVVVHTERREEHPRIWTRATIEYVVQGRTIDRTAVERAIQLSSEKYCSVQNMLKASVPIETKFEIVEEELLPQAV